MNDAIIVALITGACSVLAVIITNMTSNRKVEHQLEVAQAVTETKIEQLTESVNKHNEFGRKIPVIEEQIKVINHRIEDLEKSYNDGK